MAGFKVSRCVYARGRSHFLGGLIATVTLIIAVLAPAAPASATASWSIKPVPNAGTNTNILGSVSCATATRCTAVGVYQTSGGTFRTLVEAWNGSTWTRVSTPNVGNSDNALLSVSCVAETQCVAVGYYTASGGILRTLVLTRNGGSWIHTGSPNVGNHDNVLSGVSCLTITGCKAVGTYNASGGIGRTLTLASHGGSWSHVSSPNVGNSDNTLGSVFCVSPTSCEAVGEYKTSSDVDKSLVLSWNGASWSKQSSPNTGTHDNILEGVSCVSSTSCKAVGTYLNASGDFQTLILSWNGTSWSKQSSPNTGHWDFLSAVSCASGQSCKAVGSYIASSGLTRTLILVWNGTSWSRQSSPNSGSFDNDLLGVSCPAPSPCHAVGSFISSAHVARALDLQYG